MPGVVHPNEDAEHIGLEIEDVALNAGIEIDHAVAADASVENMETIYGSGAQEFGSGHHGVSLAETWKVIGGCARIAVAAAIGDGIALEEDGGIVWDHIVNNGHIG